MRFFVCSSIEHRIFGFDAAACRSRGARRCNQVWRPSAAGRAGGERLPGRLRRKGRAVVRIRRRAGLLRHAGPPGDGGGVILVDRRRAVGTRRNNRSRASTIVRCAAALSMCAAFSFVRILCKVGRAGAADERAGNKAKRRSGRPGFRAPLCIDVFSPLGRGTVFRSVLADTVMTWKYGINDMPTTSISDASLLTHVIFRSRRIVAGESVEGA